jgi:hypothetical protein
MWSCQLPVAPAGATVEGVGGEGMANLDRNTTVADDG